MADFISWTLPMPVVATAGSTVSLTDILKQSFGGLPANATDFFTAYWGAADLYTKDFDYWNPASGMPDRWLYNGTDIGPGFYYQNHITAADVSNETLAIGNVIGPTAFVTIPIAGPDGSWTEYIEYHVMTIEPDLILSTAGKKAPTAADIVSQAYKFFDKYGSPVNSNDCHLIACAVAASAGATMPAYGNTQNVDDPSQNTENGFWRIAYRGSDPNPVSHWQTLVKPGDIVRMAWSNGGFHTTTVLAVSSDKQTMTVYDNTDTGGTIGVHDVQFDTITKPGSITIYRLTTDNYYLENGTDTGEIIPGSIFNDKTFGLGGDDILYGMKGNDWLDGGAGTDTLIGGIGNDTYVVDNAHDVIKEISGQGTDKVLASTSYRLATGVSVETLATTSSASTKAINLIGNSYAQTLIGNAGANSLNGMGGADRMSGLGGNDTYYVDNVRDVIIEAVGKGTDRVIASVSYTLAAGVSVENLSTMSLSSTKAINLTGNAYAQVIVGNAAANSLNGMSGNDTLAGGLGNDRLTGGLGNDTFLFNTKLGANNVDVITDFHNVSGNNDRIHLDDAIFKSLDDGTLAASHFRASADGVAKDHDDYVVYDSDSGRLYYDADGSGSGKAVQFAVLTGHPTLTAADFYV